MRSTIALLENAGRRLKRARVPDRVPAVPPFEAHYPLELQLAAILPSRCRRPLNVVVGAGDVTINYEFSRWVGFSFNFANGTEAPAIIQGEALECGITTAELVAKHLNLVIVDRITVA